MLKELFVLDDAAYKRIVPALFAYMFDRINMAKFLAYVGDRAEGTRIKDVARASGYVMKNCKLYAYACHAARKEGRRLPTSASYGVDSVDANLLRRLNLSHLNPNVFPAATLQEFDRAVLEAVNGRELKQYIGKFVSKKMSFLMKSYGEKRHDIEAYLQETAIASMYKQYPRFHTTLHMINVAKAQIHNKGQSFITSSTTKSRQRLQKDAEGLDQAVIVPIDSVVEQQPESASYANELKERITALAQIENKLPERTRGFLTAAMGHYHAGFSEFLRCDNSIAVDNMSWDRYMTKLHTYYGTTTERTAVVYAKINALIHRTGTIAHGTKPA